MDKVRSKKTTILFFTLPGLLMFVSFALYPLVMTVGLSFTEYNIGGFQKFVGLWNYIRMFSSDSVFRIAVKNTLTISIFCAVIQIPAAILVSWLIYRLKHGKGIFKTAFFIPNIISSAAIGLMWMYIFNYDYGLLNALLRLLGLGNFQHAWLGETDTALYCLIFVMCWQSVGYHMIIFLTAIEGLPATMMEAAAIDGANSFKVFWKIVLPNITPIIKVDVVLVLTGSMRAFDIIRAMTGGGPSHGTEVIASHMYMKSFQGMSFGYGSALAVFLMAVCVLISGIVQVAFRYVNQKVGVE